MTYNVETEISDIMAKEMAAEVDWCIIADMLHGSGWTKVIVAVNIGIEEWLAENCTGQIHHRNNTFLFKNEQDAVLFKLRWA